MSYTYDTAGNIRSISGPSVSKSFSYNDSGDWKDLLTSVTVNGTTRNITYEEENGVTIGNPLSYFNGTQYTLAWQNGRQLASLSGGGKSATYTYGADGIRTRKTVTDSNGTTTYQYTTQNGQIARQSWSAGGTAYQMDFIYDAAGRPLAMYYRTKAAGQTDFNGDSYYYETNQQGDVTGLYKITYNATTKALSATRVASYEYDTWGNVTYSTGTMAKINPLKYRGYYHDAESGFYYLQSRYYDPAIGRFVNADGQISLDGSFLNTNQFAYCGNNPVNQVDPEGNSFKSVLSLVTNYQIAKKIHNLYFKLFNRRRNAKAEKKSAKPTKNRLIYSQHEKEISGFQYGLYSPSYNACETVAVHNAKVLLGIDSTLVDTMEDFQAANAMSLFGIFGSWPSKIGKVLQNEGIGYTTVRLDEMDKPGTYIISFWNGPQIHTVAVSNSGEGYTTYNFYGNENNLPANYAYNYICGYYLG